MLPICLLLTYSREVVVLGGGPAGLVRDRARRTVDPEVWTWQLIRESRWRSWTHVPMGKNWSCFVLLVPTRAAYRAALCFRKHFSNVPLTGDSASPLP